MSLLIEQIELLVLQHIQRQTQLQIEDAIKEIEQRQKTRPMLNRAMFK